MKILRLTITMLASTTMISAATKWTYQIEQGEDATSTHYYFYHTTGKSIDLVRWVWNGGAQNKPTVTDYIIDRGKITIRHYKGKRKSIPDLVAGRDAELILTLEHAVSAKDVESLLLSASFKEPLTKRQRADLKNLQSLLAEIKHLMKKSAEQVVAPDG